MLCFLPPADDLTRRRLLGAGLAAVGSAMLTGCGGGAAPSSAPEGRTATVTNTFGTYEIPLEPQRLMLMENRVELEVATALGLTVASVGDFYTFTGGPAEWVAPWVPYRPSGSEQRFKSFETNTEAVLAIGPDLILSSSHWLSDDTTPGRRWADLVPAAPVVPIGLPGEWREDLRQVARWLGREDVLAGAFDEFARLRDDIRTRHADTLAEAAVAYGSAEDPFLWLADAGAASLPATVALRELGGKVVPLGYTDGWLELAEEQVGTVGRADAALLWAPDAAARSRLTASPVWSGLDVVRAGRTVVSEQNVGSGQIYTIMECMRLWDRVYATLA